MHWGRTKPKKRMRELRVRRQGTVIYNIDLGSKVLDFFFRMIFCSILYLPSTGIIDKFYATELNRIYRFTNLQCGLQSDRQLLKSGGAHTNRLFFLFFFLNPKTLQVLWHPKHPMKFIFCLWRVETPLPASSKPFYMVQIFKVVLYEWL